MKGIPIPLSVAVILIATVLLIIFFGAWTVSLDAKTRDAALTYGVASGGANLGLTPFTHAQTDLPRAPGEGARAGSKAETWWGKSLILACPLH